MSMSNEECQDFSSFLLLSRYAFIFAVSKHVTLHVCHFCLWSQVNEAEEERLRSEREHMRVTHACQEAEARVQMLQKSLKRAIVKSKPYFELKAQFNQILEVKPSGVIRKCSLSQPGRCTVQSSCLLLSTSHCISLNQPHYLFSALQIK